MDNTDDNLYLDKIAAIASKREIASWERKCVTLDKLLKEVEPIQEEILAIIARRQPLIDQIESLRYQMTQECIHPREHLIVVDNHALCKFCNTKMVLT